MVLNGNVVCQTASFHPAIFTCTNDNSVGVPLSSSNSPTLSISSFLYCPYGGSITNVRFCYAWNGISGLAGDLEISDCQFVNCDHPITANSSTTNLGLHNILITMNDSINNSANFCGCAPGAITLYSTALRMYGEHVTADLGSQYFIVYYTSINPAYTTIALTNSIIISPHLNPYYSWGSAVGINPSTNATYYATTKPANLFQRVGAANYYLPVTSSLLNAGTANIAPAVLADIRQKTTFAPIVFSDAYYSSTTNLYPVVQRDTNANPAIGYHYDPIDFAFGATMLTNATLTVMPGTVIAGFDTNASTYGLAIGPGAQFICQGTPTSLNRIVNYNTVQEAWSTNWTTPAKGILMPNWLTNGPASVINCRFADFSVIANDTALLYAMAGNTAPVNFQDCQFHGGSLISTNPTINLINCLLERASVKLWSYDTNTPCLRNDLFWYGTNDIQFPGKTGAVVQDNMFDHTGINDHGSTGYIGGYNGYVTNCNHLTLTNGSDAMLTNSPSYQSGALGSYYLPSNSSLTNKGSTNANLLGLYHYTTQTNQVKETNSIVDIGYHYVALNSNGQPDDTDGDGIPDYLEDDNGNGVLDSGETDWQNRDTDYDGRTDFQEEVDGTDPTNPDSVLDIRLGYWPFDNTNTWVGSAGQVPLLASNVVGKANWDTNAVLIDSTNAAFLTYRDVETNGNANINLRSGTVRFWFSPDWSSASLGGGGPQQSGRLIEMGQYNPAFTNGWWALYFSTNGNNMLFGSSTNGAGRTNLTGLTALASNQVPICAHVYSHK